MWKVHQTDILYSPEKFLCLKMIFSDPTQSAQENTPELGLNRFKLNPDQVNLEQDPFLSI